MRKPFLFILIVGPDGAGKSTLAKGLSDQYTIKMKRNILHKHFRVWSNDNTLNSKSVDPMLVRLPRSLLGQFLSILWRFLNYSIWFFRRGDGQFLIQERGWWDQFYDPNRYQLDERSKLLISRLSLILPKPEIYICLTGDSDVIWDRKREMTVTEISKIQDSWKSHTANRKALSLDTTNMSPEQVLESAAKAIDLLLIEKISKSLKSAILLPTRLHMMATAQSRTLSQALYRPLSIKGKLARQLMLRKFIPNHVLEEPVLKLIRSLICEGFIFEKISVIRSSQNGRLIAIIQLFDGTRLAIKYNTTFDSHLFNESIFLERFQDESDFAVPHLVMSLHTPTRSILVTRFEEVALMPAKIAASLAENVAKALEQNHVIHGDFTAWNLVNSNPPLLLDWENARIGQDFEGEMNHYIASSKKRLPIEKAE